MSALGIFYEKVVIKVGLLCVYFVKIGQINVIVIIQAAPLTEFLLYVDIYPELT